MPLPSIPLAASFAKLTERPSTINAGSSSASTRARIRRSSDGICACVADRPTKATSELDWPPRRVDEGAAFRAEGERWIERSTGPKSECKLSKQSDLIVGAVVGAADRSVGRRDGAVVRPVVLVDEREINLVDRLVVEA